MLSQEPLVPDYISEALGPDFRWLRFLATVPLIFLFVRGLDALVFNLTLARRRISAPPLLRDIISIVLYLVLFTAALSKILDVQVTTVLAGGTVVAAVLALALQETLGNLFAGIALNLEDSFEVGDVIKSGDFIGTVEAVSWRATRIRTFNNDVAILPNSLLARERLEVHPRNNLNGRVISIGVDWHVPPAIAIDILSKAAAHVEGVAREMPCFARVAAFGDSSVTYDVKYFVRDYSQRDRIDADIRKAIWYAMRRNNIAIPFPIRAFQQYTPPDSTAHHDVPRPELLELLRNVDILSPLSDEAHEAIAGVAKVHFYSKGEAILRLGTAGDSMFVVHEGTVSIRVPDEVAQLGPGSVFGEMALLTGEARTADVVALTDVTALEIGKDSLQPILSNNPDLVEAITAKVVQRKGHLDAIRLGEPEEEETSIVSRVRAWFGL